MNHIKVMVNGLPGNMAVIIAKNVIDDGRFKLIPQSLTGPEITQDGCDALGSVPVRLIKPDKRDEAISQIIKTEGPLICVDYTHPSAVNDNASFYCRHELPFVMGTTGGDRSKLNETVEKSSISAVISPNMAKQIVGFQAMMEYAADSFPNLFSGYNLQITESHQKGKADTSGTAKAMVGYFNRLGLEFETDHIEKIRDTKRQKKDLKVPEEYLGGHGWHTYQLTSGDGTVQFSFTHNVNGREIYAKGTLDAIVYLKSKIDAGIRGRVFSMIDVLKGA